MGCLKTVSCTTKRNIASNFSMSGFQVEKRKKKCSFLNRRQSLHFTALWSHFRLMRKNTVKDRPAERFKISQLVN